MRYSPADGPRRPGKRRQRGPHGTRGSRRRDQHRAAAGRPAIAKDRTAALGPSDEVAAIVRPDEGVDDAEHRLAGMHGSDGDSTAAPPAEVPSGAIVGIDNPAVRDVGARLETQLLAEVVPRACRGDTGSQQRIDLVIDLNGATRPVERIAEQVGCFGCRGNRRVERVAVIRLRHEAPTDRDEVEPGSHQERVRKEVFRFTDSRVDRSRFIGVVAAAPGLDLCYNGAGESHDEGGRQWKVCRSKPFMKKVSVKLPRELPLEEGTTITITIHPTGSAADRLCGLIQWKGSLEDLEYLAESDDNHIWAVEE